MATTPASKRNPRPPIDTGPGRAQYEYATFILCIPLGSGTGVIERDITPCLTRLFGQYPFVTVTGPRQSGKTTLCRAAFPQLKYVNLEAPDQRDFARTDPRGFLAHVGDGAILDEIQRVPDLLSYLQVFADEERRNSLFVLTGSEHFKLSDAISQSLAGRTGLLRLLPFSLAERERTGADNTVEAILHSGFYPRIYDQGLEPGRAYADYFETYVERDVRRLGEIRNRSGFRTFVRLCAGRVGQLTNLSALGSDAGVSHTTARHWLGLLETSFVAFRLPPFHANLRRRLIKSPKLYFYDVGLASYLIGIERPEQIVTHPLRGPLFENMVVVEALKYRYNLGRPHNLSFFRDSRGLECDLLFKAASQMAAIEIKAGATVGRDFFDSLEAVSRAVPGISMKAVVYGGADRQSRSAGEVVPFDGLHDLLDRFEVDEEIASLVQDRLESEPPDTGDRMLDALYARHIRPTIDGVEGSMRKGVASLFHKMQPRSYLRGAHRQVTSGSLLDSGSWQGVKDEHLVMLGSRIGDDHPLEITHELTLAGYNRLGGFGADLVVSLSWRLDKDGVLHRVSVAGTPVPRLETRIPYAGLSMRNAPVDRTCAAIQKAIMSELDAWSLPG